MGESDSEHFSSPENSRASSPVSNEKGERSGERTPLHVLHAQREFLAILSDELERYVHFMSAEPINADMMHDFLQSIDEMNAHVDVKYSELETIKGVDKQIGHIMSLYTTKTSEAKTYAHETIQQFSLDAAVEEEDIREVTEELNGCVQRFESLMRKMDQCTQSKKKPEKLQLQNPTEQPKQKKYQPTPLPRTKAYTSHIEIPAMSHYQSLANTLEKVMTDVVEPNIFKGDPFQFLDWEVDLDEYMNGKQIPDRNKIRHLKKFIDGTAKSVIEEQLFLNTHSAYLEARQLLRERFGKKKELSKTFTEKISKWPRIGNHDGKGVMEFADFLAHARAAMKDIPSLRSLNKEEENDKLCRKLPVWLQQRWDRIIDMTEERYDSFPSLTEFVDFLRKEARIMLRRGDSQPISSTPNSSTKYSAGPHPKPAVRTYSTTTTASPTDSVVCSYCNKKNHSMDKCHSFGLLSQQEKEKIVRERNLCFGCLKADHRSKDCTSRATCQRCGKRHPTVLHLEPDQWRQQYPQIKREAPTAEATQQSNNASSDKPTDPNPSPSNKKSDEERKEPLKKLSVNLARSTGNGLNMVLPVYISTDIEPEKQLLCYAMLDSQATDTLITTEMASLLNAQRTTEEVEMETLNNCTVELVDMLHNLKIRGYNDSGELDISPYTWNDFTCDRKQIPCQTNVANIRHLKEIAHEFAPLLDIPVGILIGRDCSDAFAYLEIVRGGKGQPFATKSVLGWTAMGATANQRSKTKSIQVKACVACPVLSSGQDLEVSQEDLKFLSMMKANIQVSENEGSYQMPLPFKERPNLPDNRIQAIGRLNSLMNKFKRDNKFEQKYREFINELIENKHAEEITDGKESTPGESWYIPHFAVTHPKKDKLRVVFDCSAKYNDISLNDHLLQGPDLVNNLTGILLRFRQWPVALACDIEKMYYNFYVNPEDRNFLRFVWPDSETGVVRDYRMTVHIFGAKSSPAVATYGLRHLASSQKEKFPEAADFIIRNFYVDDGVISVKDSETAISLVNDAIDLCKVGNLRLHKFVSNSKHLIEEIPGSERNPSVEDLFNNSTHRTLGMEWTLATDRLTFTSNLEQKPATRRGILSTVAQIFDPLGLLSPYTLMGKNILQRINNSGVDWDEEIPVELQQEWKNWLNELPALSELQIERCLQPESFGAVTHSELHHFADASFNGISACSYLKVVNQEQDIHCSLVMAKSRVIPSKGKLTIPRLELQAALMATQLSSTLHQELDIAINQEYYYSDSMIVLGYIMNDAKRFHVYVANRVNEIRQQSKTDLWRHIAGELNPADIGSRGRECSKLPDSMWFDGPDFLRQTDSGYQKPLTIVPDIEEHDPEVKKLKTYATSTKAENPLLRLIEHYSNWSKLVRVVAKLKVMANKKKGNVNDLTASNLKDAEKTIILAIQMQNFRQDMTKENHLRHLKPFLDEDGILRVGGRASKSEMLTYNEKHPIIIPKDSHIAKLIILNIHKKTHHMGRTYTLTAIREAGYWIVCGPRMVKSIVKSCVMCRYIKAAPSDQLMGELPAARVSKSPPFTHTGMDCFGPITVKDRRTTLKRYGLLFTCLYSRAIHIEVLDDLTSDAFLNGLRSFMAIRGPVHTLYCDNGTNFVGAKNELDKQMMKTLNDSKPYLIENQIEFLFNTPTASHEGGVWERQIRTVRAILMDILPSKEGRVDSTMLRTALYEVMAIVNNRPISMLDTNNPDNMPITPNALLTGKMEPTPPPPGDFMDTSYCRERWQRVQNIAEEFWVKWRVSYLENIMKTQKWTDKKENLRRGNIVLLVDQDLPRNHWKRGIVDEVHAGDDGLVRKVTVRIGNKSLDRHGKPIEEATVVKRPVQKLIKLM